MTTHIHNDQLFTRFDHASELAIHRLLVGELEESDASALREHFEACEACESAFASARTARLKVAEAPRPAWLEGLEIPVGETSESATARDPERDPSPSPKARAMRSPDQMRPGRDARWRGVALAAVMLLVAAGTGLFIARQGADDEAALTVPSGPEPPHDGIRIKGAPLHLELYATDGDTVRRLNPSDLVKPGERVGFKVDLQHAGHFMIVGIDDTREPYLCYPLGTGNAKQIDGPVSDMDLENSMRFDGVPGHERIIGVFCDRSFTYGEVAARLRKSAVGESSPLPLSLEGCFQSEILLEKGN